MDELKERCKRFLEEFCTPVTQFCKKVQISSSGYYAWRNGQLVLSEGTLERIDSYLKQYGF